MTKRRSEQLLDECLEMLRAGAGIEDCVAPYPEHAAELRQQLLLAQTLFGASPTVLPRPSAQSRGRAVLLSAVAERARTPEPSASPLQALSTGLRRLVMVPQALPALLILLVLGGAAGVSAAATGSPTAPLSRLLGAGSSDQRLELQGTVASVGAASFTITTDAGPQTILITRDTKFEGIAMLGQLHAGDDVKVRATTQADGTLVALEIEREQSADYPPPASTDDAQDDGSGLPGNDDDGVSDDRRGPGDGESDDDRGHGNDADGVDEDNPGEGPDGDDDADGSGGSQGNPGNDENEPEDDDHNSGGGADADPHDEPQDGL